MTKRRLLMGSLAGLLVLGAATAVFAFYKTSGTGTASATTGSLAPPTGVSGSATLSTVTVSWTDTTNPGGGTFGYYITRTPYPTGVTVDVCNSSPTGLYPQGTTACNDLSVPNGTYTYSVVAVFNSFSATGTSAPVTVAVHPTASAPGVSAATTSGSNPEYLNQEDVTLTDTASANSGPPVASVAYYYCPTSAGTCTASNGTLIGSSTSGPTWSFIWTAANLPADGTYNVIAVATNTTPLNSAASSPTEIGIDRSPPTVPTPNVNGFS
jgi:hypothetical protein